MSQTHGIRMKDVAERAGVSTATVSYVLNGSTQVGEETRRKVLEVVEELKYRRNTIAKTLRTSKSATIGVIVEDMTVFNAPKLIDGVNEFTEKAGYHIVLSNLRLYSRIGHDHSSVSSYSELIAETVDILMNRQIDGIIYIGEHTRDVTGLIGTGSKPCVYTYCYTRNPQDYSINYDDYRGALDAVNHLIDSRHRRIGTVTGLEDSMPTRERLRGYRDALENAGIVYDETLVGPADWEYGSGKKRAEELLDRADRPSAIFAMNDVMAAGAVDAARERGFSVPEELSVIGFDNREFGAYHRPKLTTMDLPLREMGGKAADILLELIRGRRPEEHAIWLPCRLLERESTAPGKEEE